MNEQTLFLHQALDALLSLSAERDKLSLTMKELLNRMSVQEEDIRLDSDMSHSNGIRNESTGHTDSLRFVMPSQTIVDENNTDVSSLFSSRSISTTQLDTHHNNTSTLNKQYNAPNEGKFPCDKCQLVFLRDTDLKRHAKAHLLLLPNVCSQCGKGFARKDALKRHMGTLSCDRNRKKLIEMAGSKFEEIIKKAQMDGIGI